MLQIKLTLPLLAAALALGGCATPQSSQSDIQIRQIEGWLPGHYDNRAQVATDRKHGGPVHPAVSAVIVRVDSLMVGDHVYYLQESDSDDPQKMLGQYIISIESVKDKIVEAVWTFSDPKHWHGADEMPELLTAMQPADLKLLTGCSLEWKKVEDHFAASNDPKLCHSTPISVPAAVSAHWRIELSADQLGISEQAFDSDGDLVYGTAEDAFIRLRKRSNTPQ
ncbi:MAG TPA: chromophore lyase CpcT/CpeT [Steroidobacteraceae bacterium]|nr:chromophore lyase CpcT/CpeT [Steroidobacteraceae bacterium]